MQKLMDQNQQLLLNTQSENKHLLALTHDGKTDESQVQDGEYKETETNRKQEMKKPKNQLNSNLTMNGNVDFLRLCSFYFELLR